MADFVYFNINPDKHTDADDCVARALALCGGLKYNTARKLLAANALEFSCDALRRQCYDGLLTKIMGFPRANVEKGISVNDFADTHPKGTFLVRMRGHMTSVVNGKIYDIFDCRRGTVTNAWRTR